jgi:hypothetical protein
MHVPVHKDRVRSDPATSGRLRLENYTYFYALKKGGILALARESTALDHVFDVFALDHVFDVFEELLGLSSGLEWGFV